MNRGALAVGAAAVFAVGAWALPSVLSDAVRFVPIGRMFEPGSPYGSGNLALSPPGTLLVAAAILALATLLTLATPSRMSGVSSRVASRLMNLPARTFLASVFLFVLIVANLISWRLLEHHPRDVDHVARIQQARTYAAGRLFVPEPPVVESFYCYGMLTYRDRMFSKYSPGGALFFGLAERLFGVSWGVNPLLGAASLLFLFPVFRRWFGEATARMTLGLACISPFFLFTVASFHSHVVCLFFFAVFLFFMSRAFAVASWRDPFLAGVAIGLCFSVRSYTAVLVGAPFVLYLWLAPRRGLREVAVLALGFVGPFLALLAYDWVLTGDPLVAPFLLADWDQRPGFGFKDHTFAKGLQQTADSLRVLSLNLLGSPVSLLFGILAVLFVPMGRWAWLLLGSAGALVAGYALYYWYDFSFGVRYYFEASVVFLLFSARGLIAGEVWAERLRIPSRLHGSVKTWTLWVLVCSMLFSSIWYLPAVARVYGNHYNRNFNTKVAAAAKEAGLERAIVFLRDLGGANNGYSSGFLANPLDLAAISQLDVARAALRADTGRSPNLDELARARGSSPAEIAELLGEGDVIYAKDRGADDNRAVVAAFPGRDVYFYRFDPKTRVGSFERAPAERLHLLRPSDRW